MKCILNCLMFFAILHCPSSIAFEFDVFDTKSKIYNRFNDHVGRVGGLCVFNQSDFLSLVEVVERILCHDPRTSLAWAEANAQAAMVGISMAEYLPRLDATISHSVESTRTTYEDRREFSNHSRSLNNLNRLNLNWVLFDFGRREAGLRNAQNLLVAANANQNAELQKAFVRAASAYYKVLAAQKRLNISKLLVELAAENYRTADAKFKSGAAALFDHLQAQTALSQARLRQSKDAGGLKTLTGVIALQMGMQPEAALRLNDDLSKLPDSNFLKSVDELLIFARKEHPIMIAAKARVSAAEAFIEEQQAAGKPTLALTANFAQTRVDQSSGQYGSNKGHGQVIGLELKIPLFYGFERNYKTRNARARLSEKLAELASFEEQISVEVWTSYQNLAVETRILQQTGELVRQSRQSMEVAQGRYRAGVGSIFELLNAQATYASAEEQQIQSLSEWQISRLQLAASLGRLGFWTIQ